jgi:hypothetical protein
MNKDPNLASDFADTQVRHVLRMTVSVSHVLCCV